MPSVATANAQGTKNKSNAVIRRLLRLAQVESQAVLYYLDMDVQVKALTNGESWAELEALAKQGRGNALTTLARLKGMGKMDLLFPAEMADYRKTFSDPAFRQGLEAYMTEAGEDITAIDRYLDKSNFNKVSKFRKTMTNNALGKQGAYAVATGFLGYWAGFIAEFNLACQKDGFFYLYTEDEYEAIMDFLSGKSLALESILSRCKELLAEHTSDEIYEESIAILLELEEQLVWLPTMAARVYQALDRAMQAQQSELLPVLADIDLRLGALARRWALVSAVVLYAAYMGTLPEDDKALKDIRKNSQKLPMESLIPYGETVTVQELAERGWANHSKLVQVTGFVRNISVSRAGSVYRTEFSLAGFDGVHQVQAIAVYENLAHQGMIGDSVVKLNAIWEMQSKLAKYPILKINRVTLSTYKKASWTDYITTVVRPWFDLYPNSHNLIWSVRPEVKEGELADESVKTGAGEIAFGKSFVYKGGK